MVDGYATAIDSTIKALLEASDGGKLPIVCENSSCSQGFLEAIRSRKELGLRIIDAVDYAAEYLLPKLVVNQKLDSVALHPTCSSTALGSNKNLELLAHSISRDVVIPEDWGCCAFAGDRGLLHPELTASATRAEAQSLKGKNFDAYLSTNLTCEIGMARATGKKYEHILCKVDSFARPLASK